MSFILVTKSDETMDAVCFRALKWLVRLSKGFETETNKLEIK